jgi:hypothetical protein
VYTASIGKPLMVVGSSLAIGTSRGRGLM